MRVVCNGCKDRHKTVAKKDSLRVHNPCKMCLAASHLPRSCCALPDTFIQFQNNFCFSEENMPQELAVPGVLTLLWESGLRSSSKEPPDVGVRNCLLSSSTNASFPSFSGVLGFFEGEDCASAADL